MGLKGKELQEPCKGEAAQPWLSCPRVGFISLCLTSGSPLYLRGDFFPLLGQFNNVFDSEDVQL